MNPHGFLVRVRPRTVLVQPRHEPQHVDKLLQRRRCLAVRRDQGQRGGREQDEESQGGLD
jgi:hypothetical protein